MQHVAPRHEIIPLAAAATAEITTQEDDLSALLRMLSRPADKSWRWDQYTQWYFGLKALEASLTSRGAPVEALSELLNQLEERLQFADGFDSAVSFDPSEAEFHHLVDEVHKQLRELPRQPAAP
jgi:hypothetical protein